MWQLRSLDLERGWIENQIAPGRLHRVFRAVYSVGHSDITAQGRALAGVLSCGSEAKLARWSATARWGLLQTNRAVIDVVVPTDRKGPKRVLTRHKGRQGITAFRAATAALNPGTRRTKSDLEDAFLSLCSKHRLPEPDSNAAVDCYEVLSVSDTWLNSDPDGVAATVKELLDRQL